jgi:hypothetical protein
MPQRRLQLRFIDRSPPRAATTEHRAASRWLPVGPRFAKGVSGGTLIIIIAHIDPDEKIFVLFSKSPI